MSDPRFADDVVGAVLAHMNADHAEDSLAIVRAFGEPLADAAVMTGLDRVAGVWSATVQGRYAEVRVPWSHTLEDRAEVRTEIVRLHTLAVESAAVADPV